MLKTRKQSKYTNYKDFKGIVKTTGDDKLLTGYQSIKMRYFNSNGPKSPMNSTQDVRPVESPRRAFMHKKLPPINQVLSK